MSTFFLQLTQDLMSQIVAARKNSTLNELKQNDDVPVTCQHLRAIYTLLKSYLHFGYKHCFYSKKGIYITCSAKRMCLFHISEFFFFPYSSNTRMEGVWSNNVLTPGVDISLFGKHCSQLLFCQPPINNESKRRLNVISKTI